MKTNAVLIIDPNESWRENLSEQLASRSVFHPISTAEDGQSALERIQQEKPDVLILELLLPQYDGLYLINQIRTQMEGYRPFIYVVTALDNLHVQERIRSLPIDYLSIKPILPGAVADNLSWLLGAGAAMPSILPAGGEPLELNEVILDFFFKMGANLSKKSTRITLLVVEECLVEPEGTYFSIIYDRVANRKGMNLCAVERSVRSTSKDLRDRGNEVYRQYFPENTAFTNSSFLSRCCYFLRKQLDERMAAGQQITPPLPTKA